MIPTPQSHFESHFKRHFPFSLEICQTRWLNELFSRRFASDSNLRNQFGLSICDQSLNMTYTFWFQCYERNFILLYPAIENHKRATVNQDQYFLFDQCFADSYFLAFKNGYTSFEYFPGKICISPSTITTYTVWMLR